MTEFQRSIFHLHKICDAKKRVGVDIPSWHKRALRLRETFLLILSYVLEQESGGQRKTDVVIHTLFSFQLGSD